MFMFELLAHQKLLIENLINDDEGIYDCKMSNHAFDGSQEKKVIIIVITKPKDVQIILNAFEDLSLGCNASASITAPVIKWHKYGKKIGDHKVFSSKAKMNDHGGNLGGNYKFTVANNGRVSSKTIKFKVIIAPFTNSYKDQFFAELLRRCH